MVILLRQSEEWNCRILTFFHGSIVSYSAIRDIIANGEHMHFHNYPLSEEQQLYLSFMLSYFLFDLSWIRLFGNESWVIYFHHISSILIITKIISTKFGGLIVPFGVAGLEMTNPYLQMRWFLRTYGYLNTPIHTIVELWLFFAFFFLRVIIGSILLYYTQLNAKVDIYMKLLFTCIYLVSLILAWDIYRYFHKRYLSSGRTRPRTLVTSQAFERHEKERRSDYLYGAESSTVPLKNQAFLSKKKQGKVPKISFGDKFDMEKKGIRAKKSKRLVNLDN